MASKNAGLTASWSDIWLLDGVRTPFADYSGALATVSPTDLGIKAAREAIDADNSGVMLVGRCEGFLVGQADLDMVIDRLNAYAEAGADCLYAPGIKSKEQIAALVKAVHPKPVNLLIGGLLSHLFSPYFATIGLTAGAAAFAGLTARELRTVLLNADHVYAEV